MIPKFPLKKAKMFLFALPQVPLKTKRIAGSLLDIVFSKKEIARIEIEEKVKSLGVKDDLVERVTDILIEGKTVGFSERLAVDLFSSLGLSKEAENALNSAMEVMKMAINFDNDENQGQMEEKALAIESNLENEKESVVEEPIKGKSIAGWSFA